MRRTLLSLAIAGLAAASPAAAADPAPSAAEIRPLLIGARVPAVELKNSAGESVDLLAAVAKKPTVLILYRGGW